LTNKKALILVSIGQKLVTSAVPPKLMQLHPLNFRTIIRIPWITGGTPVGHYSARRPFLPPLWAHSMQIRLLQSHRLQLSLKQSVTCTILNH